MAVIRWGDHHHIHLQSIHKRIHKVSTHLHALLFCCIAILVLDQPLDCSDDDESSTAMSSSIHGGELLPSIYSDRSIWPFIIYCVEISIVNIFSTTSHEIWQKLILNRQIVTTRTYLARNIKIVRPDIRNACVQRLVEMGLLEERHDIFTGNMRAFIKCPPIDLNVQNTLVQFKINVIDYESSFNGGNPFALTDSGEPIHRGKIQRPLELKAKFTSTFRGLIENNGWYQRHLFLSDDDVETVDDTPVRTTSSSTREERFNWRPREPVYSSLCFQTF